MYVVCIDIRVDYTLDNGSCGDEKRPFGTWFFLSYDDAFFICARGGRLKVKQQIRGCMLRFSILASPYRSNHIFVILFGNDTGLYKKFPRQAVHT